MRRGPIFTMVVRVVARRELLSRGHSRAEVRKAMALLDDDDDDRTPDPIRLAILQSTDPVPDIEGAAVVAVAADGTIFQRIMEWLSSDQGKAFIQLLLTILMSLI